MKRLFTLLFVAAIVLSVAGCAAPGSGGGDTIKIGLQAPLTGDFAYEGKGMEKALKLLVEQTNAAGGINGKQIELIVEDDKGDPKEAALVADRMVSNKVAAVIGAYNSSATEPASVTYNRANILHITPSSTRVSLTEKGFKQFFRVCFLDDRQGLFAAKFMKEVLGNKNIAILHDNSTYAQGLAEETKKYAEEAGLNIVFFDAINPKDQDFTPVLTKIKSANPETVYFTGYHAQAGQLLKQAKSVGLQTQWLGGNSSNNAEIIDIAGLENAKGMMFTTEPLPKDLDYPEAKQFLADYKAKYNEDAESVWWVMAADAFRVLRNAMEQTKSTDTAKLAEYLHGSFKDFPGITGPIIGFDEKGDRLGAIHKAYVITDTGEIQPYPKQPAL
ncbi:MAG: branched-chain amino acid ABC transporter substrate-binding protein [Anaerolineae bacterium]|jgi:branched-chain amino acid transport system substrate-binding protein|nr:branched-chain amino acid ABC transporter substrate-binding protein [Anaerolineae bacterium]